MDEEGCPKVYDNGLCFIIKLCWALPVVFGIFKLHEVSNTGAETRYNLNIPKTMDNAQHNFVMESSIIYSCGNVAT
jgi:hypothetical protein